MPTDSASPPARNIGFKVSTDFADYEASIVRLIHSGVDGSEFKMETVDAARKQSGRKQTAYAGSYAKVEHSAALNLTGSFTLQAWIWPTTPDNRRSAGDHQQVVGGGAAAMRW